MQPIQTTIVNAQGLSETDTDGFAIHNRCKREMIELRLSVEQLIHSRSSIGIIWSSTELSFNHCIWHLQLVDLTDLI